MKDKIIKWALRRIFGRLTSTKSCANRVEWTYVRGDFEYKIIRRQTTISDTYSREELYCMEKIIRSERERTGWDVHTCFE